MRCCPDGHRDKGHRHRGNSAAVCEQLRLQGPKPPGQCVQSLPQPPTVDRQAPEACTRPAHQPHWGCMVGTRCLGSIPPNSGSVALARDQGICMFIKHPTRLAWMASALGLSAREAAAARTPATVSSPSHARTDRSLSCSGGAVGSLRSDKLLFSVL